MGAVPVHVPFDAVSFWFARSCPEIAGACVFTGATGLGGGGGGGGGGGPQFGVQGGGGGGDVGQAPTVPGPSNVAWMQVPSGVSSSVNVHWFPDGLGQPKLVSSPGSHPRNDPPEAVSITVGSPSTQRK